MQESDIIEISTSKKKDKNETWCNNVYIPFHAPFLDETVENNENQFYQIKTQEEAIKNKTSHCDFLQPAMHP